MIKRHELVTAPSVEPVLADEVTRYVGAELAEDIADCEVLLTAAREYLEEVTGRAFITQTRRLIADTFPRGREVLDLTRPPILSVTEILYLDENGAEQTLDASVYSVVLTQDRPGQVVLKSDQSWPVVAEITGRDAVWVEYTCGYGATDASVPQRVKTALKMLVRAWLDDPVGEMPDPVKVLIGSFAVPRA